ncbi:MAG: hypothetical protein QOH76_4 [Thermoleophilaceae bacterium]|jgi:hypothetical protein|nr:hypothetical protein [Thermoleophilaceae bacterium]
MTRVTPPRRLQTLLSSPRQLFAWGGAAFALILAVALYTRFNLNGNLWRDEAIYAYGGQQLADGVPVYLSIFDPKPPLPTILCGFAAIGANWFDVNDVLAMRAEFFVFACLTVVAVYLLVLWLWNSPLAAVVGAATFASFKGFARDALEGPDAKTPGIFFAVLSMGLLVRRQWFWGAFTGSLAFLVWQPLIVYPAVAVVWAVVASDADVRWRCGARALAGAAIPVAVTSLYLLIEGALSQFIEASLTFPLTGVERGSQTLGERIDRIVFVVNQDYGNTSVLFWAGLVALLGLLVACLLRRRSELRAAVREPYIVVVILTFLGIAAVTLSDFQGYPDLFPVLPYAATGLGGAVALVQSQVDGARLRLAVTAAALVGVAVLAVLTWSVYSDAHWPAKSLRAQRADAAKLQKILDPGEILYSLGNPVPLVLTHRRNPSRFIYLNSGAANWKIKHTPGGLEGWKREILASNPAVVTISDWETRTTQKIRPWLKSVYGKGTYLGHWQLFMKPSVRARAIRRGIAL